MKIVFFDGYCNLCNRFIDLLINLDSKHVLKFASLQGETAKEMNLAPPSSIDPGTVIYLRDGKTYEKSSAILMLVSDLGGIKKSAKLLLFLPKFFRDPIYSLVSKNRNRIFGKRTSCRVPSDSERAHFLP